MLHGGAAALVVGDGERHHIDTWLAEGVLAADAAGAIGAADGAGVLAAVAPGPG